MLELNKIHCMDALEGLKQLDSESIDCVCTSPPYWNQRDYGIKGQLGLESNFEDFIMGLCNIFDEVKRVLKKEGTCWVVIDDTYFGGGNNRGNNSPISDMQKGNRGAIGQVQAKWDYTKYKAKCMCMIPERFAIEMIRREWILRNKIIWKKESIMPESCKDRFTNDYEFIYFFTKSGKYYFKQQLEPLASSTLARAKCREFSVSKKTNEGIHGGMNLKSQRNLFEKILDGEIQGRNKRAVWTINTQHFKGNHFATFPEELVKICIEAGCPENGVVLDPFMGAGTVALVALKLNRKFIGLELNPSYCEMANERIKPWKEQQRLNDRR